MTFAVIETGGKQYKVAPGDVIRVEKLVAEPESSITFDQVLLKSDNGSVQVGTPYVKGSTVSGTVRTQGREDKKIVFRYKSKTRRRVKKGHRQPYTEVEITAIA